VKGDRDRAPAPGQRIGQGREPEVDRVARDGEAVAADTGSAVTGYTIDLWFPTLADALAWGRRPVTITLH